MERLVSGAPLVVAVLLLGAALGSLDSGAFSSGKFDVTTSGCFCHCASPSSEVVPAIAGLPGSWVPASTYPLTVSFTGGPGFAPGARANVGGFNLLVRPTINPTVAAGTLRSLNAQSQVQASDPGDATHTLAGNDQSSWNLEWESPSGGFGDGNITFKLHTNSVNGDAANGFGNCTDRWNALPVTVPGPADSTPPVLSNIAAAPLANAATITWTTDERATSRVDYGTTEAYGQFRADAAFVTAHSVVLTGLTPVTQYHYLVTSTDLVGLSASSVDLQFTTTADSTPPSASFFRPLRGQIYVNDSPRSNPVDANADPIATPLMLGVHVQAADVQSGVAKVEFYVDGQLRATVTQPLFGLYRWAWPLTTEAAGQRALSAIAYDGLGNTRTIGLGVFVL